VTDPLTVDLTLSYAYRSGGDIRVVLVLPEATGASQFTWLRLRNAKRTVRVEVAPTTTADGTLVDVTIPAPRLGRSVWKLALLSENAPRAVALQARLLTSRTQPVALLPGPEPTTRMPPPKPRPPVGRRAAGPELRARITRSVDGALRLLPAPAASRVRAGLVRIGRRVLH
jgi:hypothetical protein